MELANAILNVITLLGVGAVFWLGTIARDAVQAAVTTSAQEVAKVAVEIRNWPEKLRQELEKSRGVERQELRFQSYGELWSRMRPLAIYAKEQLGRDSVAKLSNDLSAWYFSACGGMLLTSHVREFYFALQDLVRSAGDTSDDWQCERLNADPKDVFESILERMGLRHALAVKAKLADLDLGDWPAFTVADGRRWREDVQTLASRWSELDAREKFAVLQQVGSVLRTNLAHDVESRLR